MVAAEVIGGAVAVMALVWIVASVFIDRARSAADQREVDAFYEGEPAAPFGSLPDGPDPELIARYERVMGAAGGAQS